MLGIKTAVVASTAILLVTLGLTNVISQHRQKREKALRGLIAVPSFEDADQQELGPGVDIIFVHGLGSDPIKSWSAVPKPVAGDAHILNSNKRSVNWVQEFLAEDLKKWRPDAHRSVRAYWYGYNSSWMLDAPVITIRSLAKGLLAAIASGSTNEPASKDRRIIFVAHSHGGLVVKQALLTSFLGESTTEIYSRTDGVLFFGTPHQGSDLASLGHIVARILSPWGSDSSILKFIKPGSNENRELHVYFTDLLNKSRARNQGVISIWNFYEENKTRIGLGLPPRLVVREDSATFEYPDCENIPMQRDHKQLNKFSEQDTDYQVVLQAITTCIERSGKLTSSKQDVEFSEQDIEDCKRSLSFSDIDARQHNIAIALAATCEWLLKTPKFQQWQKREDLPSHNGVFWIKGKAGAGKSTLMKHIWSHYRQTSTNYTILAYFYNARGSELEKSPLGMLRSMLYQLLDQDQVLCEHFMPRFLDKRRKHGVGWQWHLGELKEFLHLEMKYRQKHIIILIDALDECNDQDVRDVVAFLESLSINAFNPAIPLQIGLSSRHYPNIDMKKRLELKIDEEEGHDRDIALYVSKTLFHRNEKIEKELIRKAQHVFMWVVLVVEMLNQAFIDGDVRAMEDKLHELPSDLDEVFSNILGKDDPDKKKTILMFQWVRFGRRLLKPEELYFAVLAGTSTDKLGAWDRSFETEETIQRYITKTSKGLIEIRKGDKTKTVQFIHESVNDFLMRHRRLQTLDPILEQHPIGSSHETLAACCLSYIMMDELGSVEQLAKDAEEIRKDLRSKYPFLDYAGKNLLQHTEQAQNGGIAQHGFLRRLEQPSEEFNRLTACCDIFQGGFEFKYIGGAELLYAVSIYNCDNLIQLLLQGGADVNAQGGFYGNVLQAAACNNTEATVKLLLDRGADINIQGGYFGNVLQAAAFSKTEATVKLLLDRGADINIQGGYYGSVLQAAACKNTEATVKLLLDRGADINIQGGFFGNALQAAAFDNTEATVKLLLDRGADINIQGGFFGNALQAAACKNTEATVKLLLDRGADINIQGGSYGNVLQVAAYRGSEATVKLLLEHGADVNAQGGPYSNALQAAAAATVRGQGNNESMVKLLLEHGADIDAQGGYYGNALQAAAATRDNSTVQLLLEHGADANVQGGEFGNALQTAAVGTGDESIIQLLLERGADVNAQGGYYGNALQAAAVGTGDESIIQLLLERGADVNLQGGHFGNALQAAAASGKLATVKLLLEHGADIDAPGAYFCNALQAAAATAGMLGRKDGESIIKLLLERGADINAQGGYYGNALQAAAAITFDKKSIIQLLLDRGADINAQGGYYGNTLQATAAAVFEDKSAIQLLLERGADVNAQGGHYGNALQAAEAIGNVATIQLLRERGAKRVNNNQVT